MSDLTLLREVFHWARANGWHRDHHRGDCGGLDEGTRRWESDRASIELDRHNWLDINGMCEVEANSVECAVDVLAAVDVLPPRFSTAYAAGRDELEEQGSALTRELELKTREAEADRSHAAELEYVAAQRLEENDHLRARIAELESRPVSAPPAVPGSRSYHLRPEDILGHNAVAGPQLVADLPTAKAHLAGDHSGCTPDWCASAPLPSGRTPAVEQLDDEIGRFRAEAGIADEDPAAIDAALNGHEPTSFIEDGAA